MAEDAYLGSSKPLRVADAVAAILIDGDGRYILQLRDDKPEIFFPNHWGCFGGAIELGESAISALARELDEELSLDIAQADVTPFTTMTFDFAFAGQPNILREFFEVRVSPDLVEEFSLGEGAAIGSHDGREALRSLTLTPYDHFALWMHVERSRLYM